MESLIWSLFVCVTYESKSETPLSWRSSNIMWCSKTIMPLLINCSMILIINDTKDMQPIFLEYYCFRSFWMRSVLFLRAANGIIIGEKRTCHDCLNWFAKGLSQKHLYTHLSFSIGTLWKLKCPPFSKYWPHPLAMHLLPLLRGVVTSGLNGVVILYSTCTY